MFLCDTGSLEDVHILDLSKRITTGDELKEFGIKVLKLPGFKIKSALYDHSNSIQAAAYDVISSWVQLQSSRQEAYTTLREGLKEAKMHQLATEVQQWIEGTVDKASVTLNKGLCF